MTSDPLSLPEAAMGKPAKKTTSPLAEAIPIPAVTTANKFDLLDSAPTVAVKKTLTPAVLPAITKILDNSAPAQKTTKKFCMQSLDLDENGNNKTVDAGDFIDPSRKRLERRQRSSVSQSAVSTIAWIPRSSLPPYRKKSDEERKRLDLDGMTIWNGGRMLFKEYSETFIKLHNEWRIDGNQDKMRMLNRYYNSFLDPEVLDLHFLPHEYFLKKEKEGLSMIIFKERIGEIFRPGSRRPRRELLVVTGVGVHNKKRLAKIRAEVINFAKDNNYKYECCYNLGLITIIFPRY